jgi:predicted outer membrane protein
MVDKMSKLSGAAFDKAYVAAMVKGHKETDALCSRRKLLPVRMPTSRRLRPRPMKP